MTLLLLWFFFDEAPKPDQVGSIQNQIGAIDTDLERLLTKMQALKKSSNALVDEIGEIELRRAIVSKSVEKFQLEVIESKAKIEENEVKIVKLQKDSEGQQRWLQSRLRNLYKRGGLGYSQLFLKQSRLSELINAYHYAKILTEKDHEVITRFKKTILDLNQSKTLLEEAQAQAVERQKSLSLEEEKMKTLLKLRNQKLRQVKR